MRVQLADVEDLSGLHWRDVALFRFDGERYPRRRPARARSRRARHAPGTRAPRRRGPPLSYRVAPRVSLATDAVLLAGQPEQVRCAALQQGWSSSRISGDLHVPDASNQASQL
ncbi:MAG: hypothetical protein R2748_32655 [Bryobacterales bacterium]